MIAIDTSVAVAAFASWHEGHRGARLAMEREPRLPAHAALETFSVLTRLPPPHRAEPGLVQGFLAEQFAAPVLTLSARGHHDVLDRLASVDIGGGAVYDAVIAATALEARVTLLTRDRRALPVYELMGAEIELID
ncbi:MAG: type II toxin-antitoxin system VapC family toxin [Actinomycetota bacterium]